MHILEIAESKFLRARELGVGESARLLAGKLQHAFGYRSTVRRLAYRLDCVSRRLYDGPYQERPESGAVNLAVKLERQRLGGPFEPPEIVLINRAAVGLIEPHQRRILEVGSGTGLFAWLAGEDPARSIVASEFDEPARMWASQQRARENVEYCARRFEECTPDEFDLAVAIEVIEHIDNFGAFIRDLCRVASSAIISTPNKQRSPFTSMDRTPAFSEHVREWTAGEFLWVLRSFYAEVNLFTLPNLRRQVEAMGKNSTYRPSIASCSDLSCEHALIAVCNGPLD